ncbi:MAG: acyltransferase family protein [Candidatus Sulfotelmatobacter sp.]
MSLSIALSSSSTGVGDKNERVSSPSQAIPPDPLRVRSFTQDLRYHPSYRPDIDGLRALAIVPVVMFHAFPAMLPGGFVGVDIFFVISGFLISSIIFKGLQRDSFSFPGFYANRIKRIFPALLLVLAVSAVFGWFFLLPPEYAQLGKHIVGGAAYAENFVLQREAGYFDTKSFLKPLMHLWSLGIEEQFYLTYPFLLWVSWRLRRNVLAILLPLVIVSFYLNVWEVHRDAVSSFFLPQTRFWELWIGGILAYVDIFSPQIRGRLGGMPNESGIPILPNVLSVAGVGLIGAALLLVHGEAFPGWWALLPVGGASLLILAGPAAWINRTILSNRVSVFVGLISYPLYLWHWPILSFARMVRGDQLPTSAKIGAVIFSVLLAWATWRFVEAPIRFGRKTWTKTAALGLTSLIILSIGYKIHDRDGFAGRFKNLAADFGWADREAPSTPDCRRMVGVEKLGYCRIMGASSPDVLLLGDSHAGALYPGLASVYKQRSQSLMVLGQPGCVPFYDTETYDLGERSVRDCRPGLSRMLNFATSTPSVRTIILAWSGPIYMSGLGFGENPGPPVVIAWDGAPRNSSQAEVFTLALRNTVSRLFATGKNIVLLLNWPELGFDPRSCLPRPVPLFSQVHPRCEVPRSQVDARNEEYRKAIFEMKKEFPGLRVFDPLPYFCDSTACHAMRDGHLLYRDDNHLSAAGSAYLASKFVDEQSSLSP